MTTLSPKVLVVLLVAAVAGAQEPLPQVAPFPLEFVRVPSGFGKKDKEDLQKLMPMLLRASDASVPDSARLSAALAELKRQDCGREDECLSQLAKLAGSLYGLYASVDYDTDGFVIATGRVVRDDGVLMGKPTTVRLLKGSQAFKDVARDSLNQLFMGLEVKKLSPFRPKVETPVAKVEPKVETPVVVKPVEIITPPPPPPPVETPSGMRTASYVAMGAGVVGLVVGGVVLATRPSFRTDSNGNIFVGDVQSFKDAQGASAVGVGVMGAGAALAVAGAVMFAMSPAPVAVSAAPVPGGAVVGVGGTFR